MDDGFAQQQIKHLYQLLEERRAKILALEKERVKGFNYAIEHQLREERAEVARIKSALREVGIEVGDIYFDFAESPYQTDQKISNTVSSPQQRNDFSGAKDYIDSVSESSKPDISNILHWSSLAASYNQPFQDAYITLVKYSEAIQKPLFVVEMQLDTIRANLGDFLNIINSLMLKLEQINANISEVHILANNITAATIILENPPEGEDIRPMLNEFIIDSIKCIDALFGPMS